MEHKYRNLLKEAQQGGYAIPAFNYTDIWEFLAIMEAATELQAPVYAASAKITVDALGIDMCGAFGLTGFRQGQGNYFNHLDHSTSVAMCKAAVDAGYHSVMFDGSALPLDENIAKTREVAMYARAHGVYAEGEVGQILGRNDESTYLGGEHMASLDDCLRMVQESGVDSLAIGIGNQHGFYAQKPKLNVDLLTQVSEKIDTPLVLHGGTGLEEQEVLRCIQNGIAKVNVGTAIHCAYKQAVANVIGNEPKNFAVTSFTLPAKEAMKEIVRHWILLCGADGKKH